SRVRSYAPGDARSWSRLAAARCRPGAARDAWLGSAERPRSPPVRLRRRRRAGGDLRMDDRHSGTRRATSARRRRRPRGRRVVVARAGSGLTGTRPTSDDVGMYETLTVHREDHLTWLTLDRPDALNAMNSTLVRELRQFFWELPADLETRVLVLRGA